MRYVSRSRPLGREIALKFLSADCDWGTHTFMKSLNRSSILRVLLTLTSAWRFWVATAYALEIPRRMSLRRPYRLFMMSCDCV